MKSFMRARAYGSVIIASPQAKASALFMAAASYNFLTF
jgi:hypothetical protein